MTLHSIEDRLAEHAFFADLPADRRALVAGCGRHARFDAGAALAREGAPAETFHAVREGRVAIQVAAAGRPPLVIATLGPGSILGWSWLFPPYRWLHDAVAVEPVRTIEFDGACLRGKCDADPALGYDLMRRFAAVFTDRLAAARMQLLDLYGDVARA